MTTTKTAEKPTRLAGIQLILLKRVSRSRGHQPLSIRSAPSRSCATYSLTFSRSRRSADRGHDKVGQRRPARGIKVSFMGEIGISGSQHCLGFPGCNKYQQKSGASAQRDCSGPLYASYDLIQPLLCLLFVPQCFLSLRLSNSEFLLKLLNIALLVLLTIFKAR